MKIDAHHHFWKYDPDTYSWMNENMDILKVDYQPADLKRETEKSGIDGVVSVQADQSFVKPMIYLNMQRRMTLSRVWWVGSL